MLESFLLQDLKIDKAHFTNKVIGQCHTWGHFGTGRFKFYVGDPDDDTLDIIDNLFQDADQKISAVAFNLVRSNNIIGPHADYGRGCTINIPICGNFKDSTLDSYECTEPVKVASAAERFEDLPTSLFFPHRNITMQVAYQFPICFDTRKPHGVTNVTTQDRFILGITFKEEYTLSSLRTEYKKGNLLK